MSELWKSYWPIFERLEAEFCDLSFSVAFCDNHLKIYSSRFSELLIRTCSECENVAKSLCSEKGLVSTDTNIARLRFPDVGNAIASRLSRINTVTLSIVWPYQSFSKMTVTPFDTWQQNRCRNPAWFDAYNKIKHDRVANAAKANLEHTKDALGGLLILNLWLREEDITADTDDIKVIESRVTAYSQFFSPASFLQPGSADGISTSMLGLTRLRNLTFRWP